jgi:general secretion pathway protein H
MTLPPRGFTLLEIMVVLVLIGIITSFALLSVGGGPRERLAEEGQRLAALVELHQQEAILSGEVRGIRFTRTGYAILSLDEKGEWQPPVAADHPDSARTARRHRPGAVGRRSAGELKN